MVEYKCNLCDRIFNRKSTYDDHKLRKTLCNKNISNPKITIKTQNIAQKNNIINDNIASNNIDIDTNNNFQCELCKNIFSNKSHLTRHIRNNCKEKRIKQKENNILEEILKKQNEYNEALMIKQNEYILKMQKEYDDKILKMQKDYEIKLNTIVKSKKIAVKKNNINNNIDNSVINNGVINNNTNNINICALGFEDISKLSAKVLRSIYISDNDELFLNSIQGINFNPDLPQNHNISYSNLRSNNCQVYEDNIWKSMDIKEVIKMLLSSHSYYIKRIVLENNNLKLSKYIRDNILLELIKYNRYIVKPDEIERVMEDLKIDVLDDIVVCHKKIYEAFKRLLYNKTKELGIKTK